MYVIGTAGHVDHGKSTLVKALTGIDPDRLAEEKAREMTIDLGFAWLTLTDGQGIEQEIGVVDVPGHRDFIENMLAGVGGIDLALLVIAADEGVMPQTREHLAILDLLQIEQGVIALTKVDLVPDVDWLELVKLDVAEVCAGTRFARAPIVPVSARTGHGLNQLKQTILHQLQQTTPRPDEGRPRLPIDRVFSLSGFGTVVTGTLMGGQLQLGELVELRPGGLQGRIRGLQTHRQKRERVLPGSRVAVNLTGIEREAVQRGQLLTKPGVLQDTVLLDAQYRHLADAGTPLQHNTQIKLFVGSAEILGHVRILVDSQIKPGQTGWIQLALSQPAAVVHGDRFILRLPSPSITLGGGQVLDPHPGKRHRRFKPELLIHLQTLSAGTPSQRLLQALRQLEPTPVQPLIKKTGLDTETAQIALAALLDSRQALFAGTLLFSADSWQRLQHQLQQKVAHFHAQFPLKPGPSREELRSRLKLTAATFQVLVSTLSAEGLLVENQTWLALPTFSIHLTLSQITAKETLWQQMENAGINSPSVKECKTLLGDDLYFALVELGELRPLNNEVVYTQFHYQQYKNQLLQRLKTQGKLNAAQLRDLFNTSRKYAIAWLEHFDEQHLTRRVGDDRKPI